MFEANKKRIFWFCVIGIFIIFLIVMRISDFIIIKNQKNEENTDKVNIIENTILILSDGSIDSSKISLKKEQISYKFLCNDYTVTENVVDKGMYNSILPVLKYNSNNLETYEYIICSAGFLDFCVGTEIGDFDSDTSNFAGYLYQNLKNMSKQLPDSKIILISIPYYDGLEELEDNKYTIADYNLALEMVSKQFDNVYYLDIYTDTLENPISLHNDGFYYEKDTNYLIYDKFINLINDL